MTGKLAAKTCPRCGKEYPATTDFFYRNRGRADGLHYWCKGCDRASQKEAYWENPEPKRACARRWQETHPERVRGNNKRWWAENRELKREYNARRRATKLSSPGSHTAEDILERIEEQGWMCVYCHEPLGDDYHVDHMVPLSRGGSDDPDNLAIACPSCNTSKGSKLLEEWKGRTNMETSNWTTLKRELENTTNMARVEDLLKRVGMPSPQPASPSKGTGAASPSPWDQVPQEVTEAFEAMFATYAVIKIVNTPALRNLIGDEDGDIIYSELGRAAAKFLDTMVECKKRIERG